MDKGIAKRVMDIIREQAGRDDVLIDEKFSGELGLDSLDIVEIKMAVEEEFEIFWSNIDNVEFHTPKDIIQFVEGIVG